MKNSAEGCDLSSLTWNLERAAALRNPELFVKRILGYALMPFHARWMQFRLENRETLILAPRGHGKSTILTVAYGLWRVVENPDRRLLVVSATAVQAVAFLREMRTHVERNPIFKRAFGNLIGEKWTEGEIVLKTRRRIAKEATVTALGVGGPIIGRHYDIILLDDVVDEDSARTEHMREKSWSGTEKSSCPASSRAANCTWSERATTRATFTAR
ncbi:MAG: hypothetical protein E3J72_08055 [Planctomycetota bacterium]|nr:MAG: hypothetical protein E3J72_08055 [Planctomycetota bacterium]